MMKRIVAIALSLAMILGVFALPISAASQKKFYIPTKITESLPLDNGENQGVYTVTQSFDIKNKILNVDTSNIPNGDAIAPELGSAAFLANASTDSMVNRFLDNDFWELGTTHTIARFFSNDLARYGKLKKVIFKYKNEITGEYTFTAKNNKVTACQIHFPSDPSLEWINEKYEYNKEGNISKLTQIIDDMALVASFKYDSKQRPVSYTVSFDGDSRTMKYSNYTAEGLPQNETGEINKIMHYSFNRNNQLSQYADIEDGISMVENYSYDSQGRMIKMARDNESYTFSNFITV